MGWVGRRASSPCGGVEGLARRDIVTNEAGEAVPLYGEELD